LDASNLQVDLYLETIRRCIMRAVKTAFLATLFVLLAAGVHADHGTTKTEPIDGGRVVGESYKTNLYFYRSIGGKVKIESDAKKRRWWCAWLCKTPKSIKVPTITIRNTYYADVEPGTAQVLVTAERERTCQDASSCSLGEWAVGAAPKFKFDGTPGAPGGALFPISGVVSEHTIVLDNGRTIRMVTSKGDHL
jgi:hypothetical protein